MNDVTISVEDLRISRGLTQKALADRLQVSQAHYSKVAGGLVKPSTAMVERMSDWVKEMGASAPTPDRSRAMMLSRSIRRQSRELAALLAAPSGAGALRPVGNGRRKPGGA